MEAVRRVRQVRQGVRQGVRPITAVVVHRGQGGKAQRQEAYQAQANQAQANQAQAQDPTSTSML